MYVREFKGKDRARAIRKALDFWYRNLRNLMVLKDFVACCTWKKEEDGGVTITYRESSTPVKR